AKFPEVQWCSTACSNSSIDSCCDSILAKKCLAQWSTERWLLIDRSGIGQAERIMTGATLAQSDWSVKELLPAVQMGPMTPDRGGYTVTVRAGAGAAEVFARLGALAAQEAAARARVHMGWGSFRYLDLMAARGSCWGLLCDVNIHQFR